MNRGAPMKRTAFRRKVPVRVTLPIDDDQVITIERIAPRLYRVPVPSAPIHHETPKLAPLRSEQYRRFVASFPCFACGLVGSSQCAHANEGKAMGAKTCDRRTFPLCFKHHSDLDNSRGMTRDERRELERNYVERMHVLARAAGRPEIPFTQGESHV